MSRLVGERETLQGELEACQAALSAADERLSGAPPSQTPEVVASQDFSPACCLPLSVAMWHCKHEHQSSAGGQKVAIAGNLSDQYQMDLEVCRHLPARG